MLGILANDQRDYEQAHDLYLQAFNLFEHLGDVPGKADSLYQLGKLAQDQENHGLARELYFQALDLFDHLTIVSGRADCLRQLSRLTQDQAELAQSHGNYEQARELYWQHIHLSDRLGDLRGKAEALGLLSILALTQGDFTTAQQTSFLRLQIQAKEDPNILAILAQVVPHTHTQLTNGQELSSLSVKEEEQGE